MNITQIETTMTISPPREKPIRDALQTLSGGGSVTVKVHTDTGIVGTGSAFFGRIQGAPKTLKGLIDEELAPIVVGRDPFDVRAIHEDMKRKDVQQH
jgi:L-alanine-DL-glutamate epimerase-like enolase superfamily enzyme